MSLHRKSRRKNRKRKRRLIQRLKRQQIIPAPNITNLFFTIEEIKRIFRKAGLPLPPLLPCTRVSTPKQDNKGYLQTQKSRLLHVLDAYGFPIVADENGMPLVIPEVCRGDSDRVSLEMIRAVAKEYGAIPVAESVDRWMRPRDFHPFNNPDAELTVEDVMNFLEKIRLTPFAVIVRPDASYDEVKSYRKLIGNIIQDKS